MALSAGLFVLVALGAAAVYVHDSGPPSCTSEPVLNQVYAELHDQFHLDSIFLNDIRTVSGGYFADRFACTAEVATIKGNQDVSTLPWRAVRYGIVQQDAPPGFAVTVELGGVTPFVRRKPSFWQRLVFEN